MEKNYTTLHTLAALISGQVKPETVPPADWPQITGLARQHGLEPMLWWSLKQAGCDVSSNPVWKTLSRRALALTLGYAIQAHSQQEISAALTTAGIPALWLKGAALALTIYPDPALRPMIDLDVLVPIDRCTEALAILQTLSYNRNDVRDGLFGHRSSDRPDENLPKKQHYYLRGGAGGRVVVELHFRLMGENDQLLPLDRLVWFWNQTRPLTMADGSVGQGLSLEANVLYLSAHAVLQHSESEIFLVRNLDLHLLITQQSPDWKIVIDQAVELGWTYAVEHALEQARDYFGSPVPESVLAELRTRRSTRESNLIGWRKQIVGAKRLGWIRRQLRGLTPMERVQCLCRSAFPTSAYMRQLYGLRPGQAVWVYYFRRWHKQACYFGRMIWTPRQRRP